MKIHQLAAAVALASLRAAACGLSHAEAAKRQLEFGANRNERLRSEHAWRRLAHGFTHFLALVLWQHRLRLDVSL
jgi:hypothetical protein